MGHRRLTTAVAGLKRLKTGTIRGLWPVRIWTGSREKKINEKNEKNEKNERQERCRDRD